MPAVGQGAAVLAVEGEVVDVEAALQVGGVAAEEVPGGIVLLGQRLQVGAGHQAPPAAGIFPSQPDLLGEGGALPQVAVEEVVAPALLLRIEAVGLLLPELVVAPVAVVAVLQLGAPPGGDGDQLRAGSRQGHPGPQGESVGGLAVLAPVVGVGHQLLVVVGGPGVVAVVEIGAESRGHEAQTVALVGHLGPRQGLLAAIGVVDPQVAVLAEAVGAPGAVPDPRRPPLPGREVQGAGVAQQAVAAGRQGRLLDRGRGGIGGPQVDQPGHGVRPEEGRLGALEDLGLVEVVEESRHAEAAQVDIVHDESHREAGRAFAGVVAALADAADLEVARPRGAAGPVEVGHGGDQLVQVVAARSGQAPPVEDGHRGGDLGQGLLDQAARDHRLGHGQGRRNEPYREGQRRSRVGAEDHRLVADMADDRRVPHGQGELEAAVAVGGDDYLTVSQMGAREGLTGRGVDDGAADGLRRGGDSGEKEGDRRQGGAERNRVAHEKGRFLQAGESGHSGRSSVSLRWNDPGQVRRVSDLRPEYRPPPTDVVCSR